MRTIVSFILLALGLLPTVQAAENQLPNVVFIMADDLGWKDISPFGSTFHDTPNLKRLAERSIKLTNYYAASPLCSPTRSSILTGLYPARTGITAPNCHLPQVQLQKKLTAPNKKAKIRIAESVTRLKSEYTTLAEVFQAAKYDTAHFGKWHLGFGQGYEPKDQGFALDVPHTPRAPGPGGGYFAPWKFITDPKIQGEPKQHIDEWMADQAASYIQEHKDQRFFLNFWLYSVHGPWNADPKLIAEFAKKVDPKSPQRNPLYAAMIKSMDNSVGKLLDALDEAKLTDNTIIVFTSDNGGWAYNPRQTDPMGYEDIPATSNAPLRSGKASNYEGGTRVPCMVSWPGHIQPGSNTGALMSSVDWFPTLLKLAGVPVPEKLTLDGMDLSPTLLSGKNVRETVFCHFPHGSEKQAQGIPGFEPASWVRRGDWKLIRWYAQSPKGEDVFQLFDLKADIGETTDCAASHPEVLKQLKAELQKYLDDTDAVIPIANADFQNSLAAIQGWVPSQKTSIQLKPEGLSIQAKGNDPFIMLRKLKAGEGPYLLEFRMKSQGEGSGQIFWTTTTDQGFHRDRSVVFEPKHDGDWHDYVIKLSSQAVVTGLRIDPSTSPSETVISSIRILDGEKKPIQQWAFGEKR